MRKLADFLLIIQKKRVTIKALPLPTIKLNNATGVVILAKRVLTIIITIIIGFASIVPSLTIVSRKQRNPLQAVKGSMELAEWSALKDRILKLDGEWEFYWNQLLTPADFQGTGTKVPRLSGYIQVPSLWNNTSLNGAALPVFGCATYRLVLKNIPIHNVLGLKKTNVRFSSKVYVNGHELFTDGMPEADAADYRSGNKPQLGFFFCGGNEVEILIQAANYDYINSGIPASLEIGEQAVMMASDRNSKLLGFSMLVTLCTIALLFLIFFINASLSKRRAYSLLAFAIFCFFFAIGNGLTDQRPLMMLLPQLSFHTIFKMKDFFLSASFIAIVAVLYQFRKGIVSRRMGAFVSILYGSYLLAILTLPIYFYYKVHPYIMILNSIVLIALLIKTIILFVRCKKSDFFDYILLFLAIVSINLYSADSILFALSLKTDSTLSQIYIVTFATTMIFLLSMHYYAALTDLKVSIKRTQDAEIAFLRAQIKPHFLFNALNSIAALCQDAPDRAEDVVIQLSQYLRGSFDFKTLDSLTTVKKETELLDAYLKIEKVRFGKRLNVEYHIDGCIDIPIPPLILQPLVENAVRHGLMSCENGGNIQISIQRMLADVVFTVQDDGSGIESVQLKHLLEETSDEQGIGLLNIHQRLRLLYGTGLEMWSEKGVGTRVSFRLPYHYG